MKLFLGLIFVLFEVTIPVGSAVAGLLPDFVGYFLIMKALEDRENPWRHGAFVLMLVSLVVYAAGLVEGNAMVQAGLWFASLAAEIGLLLLLHRIAGARRGVKELFPVLACVRILAALLSWLPLVGMVCAAANAVVAVCFLAAYWKTMDRR